MANHRVLLLGFALAMVRFFVEVVRLVARLVARLVQVLNYSRHLIFQSSIL
jgi:hypothetical protein